MRLTLGLLLLAVVIAHVACAEDLKGDVVQTLRTSYSAVACMAPDKVAWAVEAMKANNRVAMDLANCFPLLAGVPSKRIGTAPGGLWQVTIDPTSPDVMTVWAFHNSFVAENGDKLDEAGRREGSSP